MMVPQVKAIIKALDECKNDRFEFDSCKNLVKNVITVTDEEEKEICKAAGCIDTTPGAHYSSYMYGHGK